MISCRSLPAVRTKRPALTHADAAARSLFWSKDSPLPRTFSSRKTPRDSRHSNSHGKCKYEKSVSTGARFASRLHDKSQPRASSVYMRWQVGAHDPEGVKTRVVNEMLSAIREACEACVRQEKEERDGFLASIEQTKVCLCPGPWSIHFVFPPCRDLISGVGAYIPRTEGTGTVLRFLVVCGLLGVGRASVHRPHASGDDVSRI